MKKTIVIALLAGLALFTGCGTVDEVPSEPDELKVEESTGTAVTESVSTTTVSGSGTATTTTVSTVSTTKSSGGTATFVTNTTTASKAKSSKKTENSSTKTTAANQQSSQKTTQPPAPQQTTPPATEAPEAVTTRAVQQEKFVILDDGISFKTTDGKIQRLSADTEAIRSKGGDIVSYLIERDLDGDSHPDLFVPENVGVPNINGKYFHFNPDTGMYEPWKQLNSIGHLMSVNSDGTLNAHIKSGAADADDYVYYWGNDGVLYEKQHIKMYASGSDIFYDTYNCEGGTETLVSHEKAVLDANGNIVSKEPVPDETTEEPTTTENTEEE